VKRLIVELRAQPLSTHGNEVTIYPGLRCDAAHSRRPDVASS
jgi:hypothetical protein